MAQLIRAAGRPRDVRVFPAGPGRSKPGRLALWLTTASLGASRELGKVSEGRTSDVRISAFWGPNPSLEVLTLQAWIQTLLRTISY